MNPIIRMNHATQEPDDQPGTLHTEPVYYWMIYRRSARAKYGRKFITDPTATEAEMAAMKAKYNWNDAEYVIERGMCYNPDVASDTLQAKRAADDEAYRAKRAADYADFLARMNSPEMVARRGTFLTPTGWKSPQLIAPSDKRRVKNQ